MALWDNLIDYSYGDSGDLSSWNTQSTYSPVPQDLGFGGAFGIGDLLSSLPAFGASVAPAASAPSAVNGLSPTGLLTGGSGGGGNGLLSLLGVPGLGGSQGGDQSPVGDFEQNTLAGVESIARSLISGNPLSGFSTLFTQGLGDIRQGQYGSGIGEILLGPLGGLVGGELQSLFSGRPHTQATQQSAQTLQGQGDPVEQYLGRMIGGAAGNNRVLSESNGASSLEGESGTLADVLQILGNYTLPGLGGSKGFQLPGAPSVGVLPLGQSYGGLSEPSALSPTAYQQKFGFSQPTGQELSSFLSSPFAPTAAQGAGGQAGALSSVLGDYRSFLASGGGQAQNGSATQAADAGLGTSGFVPGGGGLSSLMQLLGNGPGGSNGLMQQINKAIQSAIGNQGQQQQQAQQQPLPWQPGGKDPWNLGMDI